METELIENPQKHFIRPAVNDTSFLASKHHPFIDIPNPQEQSLQTEIITNILDASSEKILSTPKNTSPFIEANTEITTLFQLENECTTAVFSKDNELTIAHHDFIMAMYECASKVFGDETISEPDIRVSHVIKGRIPEALRKPVQELLSHEKTMYWERLAFVIEIPTITRVIGGNTLTLCVGGVRALNHQNLYSKKSVERFKVFTGFRNKVCTNTCVSTDGILNDVKVLSINELKNHIMQLLSTYNMENHLSQMQNLENKYLTENQFCQILGRGRLYQHLPKNLKAAIPELQFNDGQLNSIAKAYFEDENFSKNDNGDINCWKMYNLLTGANKSSYIDNFLDKSLNAFHFAEGISKAIDGDSAYRWFLS
jgi:hypothetical protein